MLLLQAQGAAQGITQAASNAQMLLAAKGVAQCIAQAAAAAQFILTVTGAAQGISQDCSPGTTFIGAPRVPGALVRTRADGNGPRPARVQSGARVRA